MFRFLVLGLGAIRRLLRSRQDLLVENLALRQQLGVFKRRKRRPKLAALDKLCWPVTAPSVCSVYQGLAGASWSNPINSRALHRHRLPDVPSGTPPGVAIPASSPRSWRFLDRSHPRSQRIPSAAHFPDRCPPRCGEGRANPEAVFGCCFARLQHHLFLASFLTFLSTPAQVGCFGILA